MLMDNVLPLASRRIPDNIDMFLESDDLQVRRREGELQRMRWRAALAPRVPR